VFDEVLRSPFEKIFYLCEDILIFLRTPFQRKTYFCGSLNVPCHSEDFLQKRDFSRKDDFASGVENGHLVSACSNLAANYQLIFKNM
jgi:hypothetical protein